MRMNGLGVTDSSLHCEEPTEKRSTIDNDGIGTTGLGMSGFREIDLSLHHDAR